MTVAELGCRMSSAEFAEWRALRLVATGRFQPEAAPAGDPGEDRGLNPDELCAALHDMFGHRAPTAAGAGSNDG
jgi:hypothetical protein